MKEEKGTLIPQWSPTLKQREHLEAMALENGTTLTGYIKQLVNKDMKRKHK